MRSIARQRYCFQTEDNLLTVQSKMSMYEVCLLSEQRSADMANETFAQIYGCVSRFTELLHALVAHCMHSECEACKSVRALCSCCEQRIRSGKQKTIQCRGCKQIVHKGCAKDAFCTRCQQIEIVGMARSLFKFE